MPIIQQKLSDRPWFRIPKFESSSKKAIVIGGGLAGTSIAYALANKGYAITIVERENRISSGASGNPTAMFAPLLTGDVSDLSQWNVAAYNAFINFLDLNGSLFPEICRQIGVYQTLESGEETTRLKKALAYSKLNSLDVLFQEEGQFGRSIFFPKAGWINPYELSQAYLKLAKQKVQQILSTSLLKFERQATHWKVFLSNGEILESEIIILANSFDAKEFFSGLEKVKKVRGQILYYPSNEFPISLNTILLHNDGYIIPNVKGLHIIGSTFDPFDSSPDLNLEHNVYLLQRIKNLIPKINPADGKKMQGRVSFRAMSSDHLPVVGPVPDTDAFSKHYSDLWKANIFKDYPDGNYLHGMYISCAHGSKGILNSYLAANILACMIENESIPIDSYLLEKVNPSRFLIHSLITNQ